MKHDSDFEEVVYSTLNLLHQRVGFQTLMVTRVVEDDWIVVGALDQGQAIMPGQIFSWSDSICCRMIQDLGPMVAGDVEQIPAYRDAPIRSVLDCRSYFGFPLTARDGRLLGTLCGVDPFPRSLEIESEMPLMMTFAQSLGRLLDTQLELAAKERELERLSMESERDSLTGVLNRRGWDKMLESEEARHALYMSPGAVLIIDMDRLKEINDSQGHAAGDEAILECAQAIQCELQAGDVVARLGGDEFGVILPETSRHDARIRHQQMTAGLHSQGVEASVGFAMRTAQVTFAEAARSADQAMYKSKARRKNRAEAA